MGDTDYDNIIEDAEPEYYDNNGDEEFDTLCGCPDYEGFETLLNSAGIESYSLNAGVQNLIGAGAAFNVAAGAIEIQVAGGDADKAIKLMHSHMIKLLYNNLKTDPSTENDVDDIVSGLWSDIEASRPRDYSDKNKSESDVDTNQRQSKQERGYFV